MGVPALATEPAEAPPSDVRSSRIGGGTYVILTGRRTNGYVEIRDLHGGVKWVPETDAASGRPTLCVPQATVMRTCGEPSDPAGIPAFRAATDAAAPPAFHIALDTRLQVWDYFPDLGRWSLVERHGEVGFVRSASLCLLTPPPDASATSRFHMHAAPASADCYQSQRERGANEIRRIVIHNSEDTIQRTIATFQTCNPAHPASAHVGIDRDGTLYRFVEDRYAAFHTGGYDGGFNAGSLGIELMASGKRGAGSMTARQERALVALIRYWLVKYQIAIPPTILSNSARTKAYNSREFWEAPVTIHRLVSAGRRTDCPTFVWPDSANGDDAFFKWRNIRLR